MKKKIPKIILMISLVPYAFVLLYGIYSAIFGFDFFVSASSYGSQAFTDSIFIMVLLLWYYLIIPICLIYQIVYFIVFIVKNKHNISKKTVLCISSVAALILAVIAMVFVSF